MGKPIRLSGVDITNVNAANAKYVRDNRIGPGAIVVISRRGDVIPKIEKVVTPAKKWAAPEGKEGVDWAWNDSGVDIFAHEDLDSSDEQQIRALTHFFTTMGVEGFRDGTCRRLYESGLATVKKILAADEEDLEEILGAKNGAKLANSLLSNCSVVYPATLAYAWSGFGRGVGTTKLWAVWNELGNKGVEKLLTLTKTARVPKLEPLVGPVAAKVIAQNLDSFFKFAGTLPLKMVQFVPEKVKVKSKKLNGQVICMTGFRDAALSAEIEENGGSTTDGMSKDVTILLVKDLNTTSSKASTAKSRGVPIMTPMGFRKKYNL